MRILVEILAFLSEFPALLRDFRFAGIEVKETRVPAMLDSLNYPYNNP